MLDLTRVVTVMFMRKKIEFSLLGLVWIPDDQFGGNSIGRRKLHQVRLGRRSLLGAWFVLGLPIHIYTAMVFSVVSYRLRLTRSDRRKMVNF